MSSYLLKHLYVLGVAATLWGCGDSEDTTGPGAGEPATVAESGMAASSVDEVVRLLRETRYLDFEVVDVEAIGEYELNALPQPSDQLQAPEFLEVCIYIAKNYDSRTIEEAIRKTEVGIRQSRDMADRIDVELKVYILNRVVCNVPQWVDSREPIPFGGWLDRPTRDGAINVLWPLSVDDDGELRLTGAMMSYMGAPYQPLSEFRAFLERYGRRYPQE